MVDTNKADNKATKKLQQTPRGQRLRDAVQRCNMSAASIADTMGISAQSLNTSFITGGLKLDNFATFVELTGADANYLLHGDQAIEISEKQIPFNAHYDDLHHLVNALSPAHAEQLYLCAQTMNASSTTAFDISLNIHPQKISEDATEETSDSLTSTNKVKPVFYSKNSDL